jgi:predicted AlkP superfamily phosphohydrolase/phosphomutase
MRAADIDWSRTRAFPLPTDLEGCIRINLKGREPQGIVEPQEYDSLCRDLAAQLAELVNPATGERAAKHVWIRNEVFAGPSQEHLPDITVTWNNRAPFRSLASASMGTVEREPPDPRTGTHSWRGFCVAQGARFPVGGTGTARLQDVAPTVLDLIGLKGRDMDGTAMSVLQ